MESAITELDIDLKILIFLADGRPRLSKELAEEIGCSGKTITNSTTRLSEAGMICRITGGWVIIDNKFLASGLKETLIRANVRLKVNTALAQLRAENYEDVTLQNVSNRTSLSPRVIEDHVYDLAPDHELTVAKESSWKVELSDDEHILDIIVADGYKKELSKVDPKSREK